LDFELSEEQVLLRNLVERFVKDRYDAGKRARYLENDSGFCREGWALLADMGLLALPFSDAHGGLGGGPVELMLAMRALGQGVAVEPMLAGPVMAGTLLAEAGTPEQVADWLPRIMAGEAHVALAHVERPARFELDVVQTTAKPQDGAAVLNGTKSFVLAAGGADAFLVSARAGASARNNGRDAIRFYLVDAGASGLAQQHYRLTDGSLAAELRLANVAAAPLAGGWDAFEAMLQKARLAIAAEMVGIMDMLFDATLDHVRSRRQFGAPIGSFQAIQHRMVDLFVLLEMSRSHLYRAAGLEGDDATRAQAVLGAKAFISRAAIRLGDECIQFHGAMGVTDELIIGHGYKRLLVLATLLGDHERDLMDYARKDAP